MILSNIEPLVARSSEVAMLQMLVIIFVAAAIVVYHSHCQRQTLCFAVATATCSSCHDCTTSATAIIIISTTTTSIATTPGNSTTTHIATPFLDL